MTTPILFKWRIALRCECVYRIEGDPDLTKPLICGVESDGLTHGMNMITKAERL